MGVVELRADERDEFRRIWSDSHEAKEGKTHIKLFRIKSFSESKGQRSGWEVRKRLEKRWRWDVKKKPAVLLSSCRMGWGCSGTHFLFLIVSAFKRESDLWEIEKQPSCPHLRPPITPLLPPISPLGHYFIPQLPHGQIISTIDRGVSPCFVISDHLHPWITETGILQERRTSAPRLLCRELAFKLIHAVLQWWVCSCAHMYSGYDT